MFWPLRTILGKGGAFLLPTIHNTLGDSNAIASSVEGFEAAVRGVDAVLAALEVPTIYNTFGSSNLMAAQVAGFQELAEEIDAALAALEV